MGFKVIEIDAWSMNLLSKAVASAMGKVLSVSRRIDQIAGGSINLPSLHSLATFVREPNPGDRRVTTSLDLDFKTFRRQEVPDCGLQCQSPWYLHLCSHLGICTSHIWYHQISQPRSRAIYRWIWIFDVNLHDLLNNFAFQERQPLISTLMRICQQMLIEPHLMQDGGVQVTKVTGTFYRT